MPEIRPFTGLLFDPATAGPPESVTAPPYDVISRDDQERYYRASPYNVVRLILGRDDPGDDARSNKYTRAASDLRSWRERGILTPTRKPAFFAYAFRFHLAGTVRSVRGVIGEVQLEEWGGSIVPHERTLPGTIADRLRLIRTVAANLSPVFGVVAGRRVPGAFSRFLDQVTSGQPDRQAVDEAGTHHSLWIGPPEAPGVVESVRQDRLMIADGHHRYTVAMDYRQEMRARHGPGPWDAMMMMIVDARSEDPPVLPIHRTILSAGAVPPPVGDRVLDMAEVLATIRDEELSYGTVRLEDGAITHRVSSLSGHPPTVCALHDQVLDQVPASELRFVPDAVAAEQGVLSGQASAAFILPPTRVGLVWNVVDGGGRLPEKSTYFWPKPRTGMVIRPLDPSGPPGPDTLIRARP